MKKMTQLDSGNRNLGRQLLRRIDVILKRLGGKYYRKTLAQVKYRHRFGNCRLKQKCCESRQDFQNLEWTFELSMSDTFPLVSIILTEPENVQDKERQLQALQKQTYLEKEIIWVKETDPVRCWNSGIGQAKGKFIWLLLEYFPCKKDYLERMVSLFQYCSVTLAIDIPLIKKYVSTVPFYVSAYDFFHNDVCSEVDFDIHRIIFRNTGKIPEQLVLDAEKEKIASELLLSLFCAQGGIVVCVDCHMDTIGESIGERKAKRFTIGQIEWCQQLLHRLPRIVIASYALKAGGGEIFPIYLCNELKKCGGSVTLLNCNLEEQETGIVDLVDTAVPIVNIRHMNCIGNVLLHLGCEIIHSHHADVDYAIAKWCKRYPYLGRHVITLHGMYETLPEEECSMIISNTWAECNKYVYIADKNLECFKQRRIYEAEHFVKLPNGLPDIPAIPIKREKLGIPIDAFVVVLASRAIPEKGWKEAIEAVQIANQEGTVNIHLVLLGDGLCRKQIEGRVPNYVHVMGTVSNVRDYFAMGDAGMLPSYYKGESFPLVVIECLMCGRPVIATGIGEIPNMLRDASGKAAGILVEVKNGRVAPRELTEAILKLATQPETYREMRARAYTISKKFSIDFVAKRYMAVYEELQDSRCSQNTKKYR